MNRTRIVLASWLVLAVCCPLYGQQFPEQPAPTREQQWLQNFVGEWESRGEAIMGPDQPPMTCQGSMKSRMLGDIWVVNEMTGNVADTSMTGIQTIGYDAAKKKYIGTWVDSMMNHLWQYEGSLDEAGKTLTLEAEGPNAMAEGKLTKFRDSYEIKSDDHIVATSSMLADDGNWITFMTGDLRRKK